MLRHQLVKSAFRAHAQDHKHSESSGEGNRSQVVNISRSSMAHEPELTMGTFWRLLKQSILAFIEDEALSRGAAIAFYTVTSIAPVLLIVIAVAGLAFGRDAAQGAITAPA